MCKGFGKDAMNPIEKISGDTPLITACERLTDIRIIECLVENGANVNAVNCNNGMPLNIIKARLKKDPDNYDL